MLLFHNSSYLFATILLAIYQGKDIVVRLFSLP